ncbi:hypothetical protein BH09PAT2_BH09PAT2_02980 [soil metagenome]
MGILAGLIAMLGWGGGDFLAALSSRKIGTLKTVFWMQLISLFLASLFFLANLGSFKFDHITTYIIVLGIAGLLQVIAYIAFYSGMAKGMVSIVSPIGSTFALVTVVLSILFYNEHIIFRQVIAIVLTFAGIFLVSTDIRALFNIKKVSLLKGVKEAIIAMFAWGISLFLIAPASKELGWFLPVFILKSFVLFFVTILLIAKRESIQIKSDAKTYGLLLAIGVLDIAAFLGYSLGVSSESASVVAPISGAFSMIAVLLARIYIKEKLVTNQIYGILLIVIGLIVLNI